MIAHTGCTPFAFFQSPQAASEAGSGIYVSPRIGLYDSFTPSSQLTQKGIIKPRNGLFLHGWHDVGVDIHGHTNLRVS